MPPKTHIPSLEERKIVLDTIKSSLSKTFGSEIVSALAYGSTLSEDFYSESDFDVLIFLKNPSLDKLNKLKAIKETFLKEKIRVDFNVHGDNELPSLRNGYFWHNNRSLYFQKEAVMYGQVLLGENPFKDTQFKQEDLQTESVRVINSLLYQTRKTLINSSLSPEQRINIMKWCIYAALYALSFKGIISKTKREALDLFNKHYHFAINPTVFLEAKIHNQVPDSLIQEAYLFISQLDAFLFEEVSHGRTSSK